MFLAKSEGDIQGLFTQDTFCSSKYFGLSIVGKHGRSMYGNSLDFFDSIFED